MMDRDRERVRQLLASCEDGDASGVENILDQGIDVNSSDNEGATALQVAAANGYDHLVRLLLMRGAALDQQNAFGFSPLLHAARHGHVSVAALLLQNQADINVHTKLGASALTLAARGGHLQTCRLLVEAGIDASPGAGAASSGGSTCEFDALHTAAHHGHDNVVRYLMDRGFDLDFRTPSLGINALMLAALNAHMTTCQVLIERGADPNLTNVNGHTPLQIAVLQNAREVKGYLDRKTSNKERQPPGSGSEPADILEAARAGDLNRITEVLAEDPSQVDLSLPHDGATPLMFAAMAGRLDIAQVLVQHGADVNKQDAVSGWTALLQAVYHGRKALAKFLLNAGADVLLPANNGCTAFDLATLIDDVDTELYRILAARAFQVSPPPAPSNQTSQAKAPRGRQNGSDGEQRSGVKAWWNRMSNRFRNLKLGRTFNSNRLVPMATDLSPGNSPKPPSSGLRKSMSSAEPLTRVGVTDALRSYDSLLLETAKSAALYTLHASPPRGPAVSLSTTLGSGSATLPVIPPFLPPPTYDTERPRMPPAGAATHRSTASLHTNPPTSRSAAPRRLLQAYTASSSQRDLPTAASPSASAEFLSTNASPSSSAGASALSNGDKSRVLSHASSASSSTLTAGSDPLRGSGDGLMLRSPLSAAAAPHKYQRTPAFARSHLPVYAAGSTQSLPVHPRSRHRSTGSTATRTAVTEDTASTLTPSPKTSRTKLSGSKSPRRPVGPSLQPRSTGGAATEDLSVLLKKLSLEGYQAIFEEQEVDMEAFLTLSDADLKELGVAHTEPRRQILAAITELNSGKGREREQLAAAAAADSASFPPRHSAVAAGDDPVDFDTWNLRDEGSMAGAKVTGAGRGGKADSRSS